MAERASIFQVTQLGPETTPGTAVDGDTRLLGTSFSLGIRPDVNIFRPNGYKFPTVAIPNREWVEGSYEGPACYNDLAYILSGLVDTVTPVTSGTTGYLWTFESDSDAADTPKTFTIEHGSAERADSFAYALFTDLTLSFARGGVEVSGSLIGQALDTDITLTESPTEIALVPIAAPQVTFKTAATAAGLAGASALTRVKRMEWTLGSRYAPAWYMNGSTSFGAHVEGEPQGQAKLMVAADDAGMSYITNLRAGSTIFLRAEATGVQIGAGPAVYKLTLDTALKITDVSDLRDDEGVYAVEWTCDIAHDSTWGKAFSIALINSLASL